MSRLSSVEGGLGRQNRVQRHDGRLPMAAEPPNSMGASWFLPLSLKGQTRPAKAGPGASHWPGSPTPLSAPPPPPESDPPVCPIALLLSILGSQCPRKDLFPASVEASRGTVGHSRAMSHPGSERSLTWLTLSLIMPQGILAVPRHNNHFLPIHIHFLPPIHGCTSSLHS